MGIQALTRFRFSNKTLRSTAGPRTAGNFESGPSLRGCSRLSTRAEQAMRARPLISMAQEPQTSSRQLESYVMGVVGLPSRVTGFAAISISNEITFIPFFQGNVNSSQCESALGSNWRLILMI